MKARFESKWANHAARAGITLVAVGAFFVLRPDIYGDTTNRLRSDYYLKFVSPKIIAEYMRTTPKPKVQIGAGPSNAEGWLNTDIEPGPKQAYLDATKRMPFPDGSIYYIFGEHVIEHVDYSDALEFFKEAHRVLALGGKIRMVTPNLLQFLALFNEVDPANSPKTSHFVQRKLVSQNWAKTKDPACLILNNELHWFGHQFVYTPAMLRSAFEQAGFTDIRQYAAGETDDPTFTPVELRPHGAWKDVNAYEAMAFEATR